MTTTLLRYPRTFATLVKLEHTVFALPFAYVGALAATYSVPSVSQLVWVTVAMVGARTLAMSLNRLIDVGIDARNPRTASRELPSGALRTWQVVLFALAALAVFLVAVYQLAPIVQYLWPIPVAGFVVYPYLKRVTWGCHLWLGATVGLAPVGAWAAIADGFSWEAWAIGGGVAAWVAGFDVLYALFDIDHDREEGLHSIPARFGLEGAFIASRSLHAVAIALLVTAGIGLPTGPLWWAGVAVVGALLLHEHSLVGPRDLRRLNAAFFTMNGVIAVVFFVFVLGDVLR
ncbi:MAG: UbiA-like polyprenyltransferase [Gaiellales bacterium]